MVSTAAQASSPTTGATAAPQPAGVGAATPVVADAAPPPPPGEVATKPEDAPPEDPASAKFAARFAALTKRERALQQREVALKGREADPEYSEYKKSRENAKLDPIGLLKAHGWDFDTLTQFVLADKKLTPEQQVALLQDELAADKKARADAEAKKAQDADAQIIATHKRQIAAHIQAAGDALELTRLAGADAEELVYSVIEQHWEETGGDNGGQIMPIDQAAAAVETFLENQAREKVLKSKKFAPKVEQPAPAAPAPDKPTATMPPTLTNRSVTGATPVETGRTLSDDESKRAAAALLRWN
jgi:hypothetical protein